MINIKLKESIFHPTNGISPFKGVSDARKVKMFFTIDSSGPEIGIIPFSPPIAKYVGGRRPWGQNTYRTLNISLNPIYIDETIIHQQVMQNQGFLFNKIVASIANGIIEVRKDANATPLTATEFSTLVFGT